MGLFFRKSVRIGPLRLSFSKSGIGLSTGVRGARVSVGPQGTFVNVGAHGVYYRQRIGAPPNRSRHRIESPASEIVESAATGNGTLIETASASQLVDASSEEILSQINERAHSFALTPLVWLFGISGVFVAIFLSPRGSDGNMRSGGIVGGSIFCLTIGAVIAASVRDQRRRTTPLFYELDDVAEARFAKITSGCQRLHESERVWRVHCTEPNFDWKRNAGASALIKRFDVRSGKMRPPYLMTNVDVWGIDCGQMKLFFLPDLMLVYERGTYGTVSFDSLGLHTAPTRFIEDGRLPKDCTIAGHTWQYVRRDGGPDRRFNNNRELPIAVYGYLEITSPTGLNIHLHVSDAAGASSFVQSLNSAGRMPLSELTILRPVESSHSIQNSSSTRASALRTLGLPYGADAGEIKAAYRRMVAMYYPDKVVVLAAEFRELAHRRMTEINAAYSELEGNGQPKRLAPEPDSKSHPRIVKCPHCGSKLTIPGASTGQTRKCPVCRQ